MKKYKLVFFNSETLKKRVYRIAVAWDSFNHCWKIYMIHDVLKYESNVVIRWDYMSFINTFANNDRRRGEYVTIKEVCAW